MQALQGGFIMRSLLYSRRILQTGVTALLLVGLALAAVPAIPAHAATFTVTRFDDPNPNGCAAGDCSLREAIRAANGTAGLDTITLPAGTYTLSQVGSDNNANNGDLDITRPLTFSVVGGTATISQTVGGEGVFDIDPGNRDPAFTVTMNNMTITGGAINSGYGAGIRLQYGSSLTLNNVTVRGNTTAFGAGLYLTGGGTVNITSSTISGNTAAGDGGAIYLNGGILNIRASTISGNTAGDDAAGIYVETGTANIYNSTITQNSAVDRGGGIRSRSGGSANLRSTIIGGNTASGAGPDCDGTVTSGGYNLVVTGGGCPTLGTDQSAASAAAMNLGALANNGGSTLTHLPALSSPAIDKGSCSAPGSAAEQRGSTRPVDIASVPNGSDGACDIGSVEASSAPGVTVAESGGSTAITEGGATDTYTVTLDTQPAAGQVVSIDVTADAQCTVDTNPIVLNNANWNTGVTVTVTAVDDATIEGGHSCAVTHTVNAAATTADEYDAVPVAGVTASVTDNDAAGVVVNEQGGVTVTEGGATDTYLVTLTSQPAAGQVVSIDVTADAQCTVDTNPIVLNNANWNTGVTVTVTAVDDSVVEGLHNCAIAHAVNAGNTTANEYDAVSVASVTASVQDDDAAGVIVDEQGGVTVTEGGATDTYLVTLTSQPAAGQVVSIDVTADAQCMVDTNPIVLDDANWSTGVTVTVAAVDDVVAEGLHNCAISHTVNAGNTSADEYDTAVVASVNTSVQDNDAADVIITESDGSTDVVEGGATDTYTITLASAPTAAVTFTITPDAQCTVATLPDPAVLDDANYDTGIEVTVTAVDDAVVEGPHTCLIAHTASSEDSNYDGAEIVDVTASVTDNDSAPAGVAGPTATVPGVVEGITLSGEPSSLAAVPGDLIVWTFVVTNTLGEQTIGLTFRADIPEALEILNISTTQGTVRPLEGRTIWIDMGNLPPYGSATFTIETRLTEGTLAEVLDEMHARALVSEGGKGVSKGRAQEVGGQVCVTGAVASVATTTCTAIFPPELPLTGSGPATGIFLGWTLALTGFGLVVLAVWRLFARRRQPA
jgi:CSLREA domain-containing protein